MRRWVGALLAVLLTGCSLVFTREPRFDPERPDVPAACTESRLAPALDAGLAAALYASAVGLVVWGATASTGEAGAMRTTGAILPLTYGTAAAASASVGFRRTRRCEYARAVQLQCLQSDRDACAELRAAADDLPGR
jgi:hypothetical protein